MHNPYTCGHKSHGFLLWSLTWCFMFSRVRPINPVFKGLEFLFWNFPGVKPLTACIYLYIHTCPTNQTQVWEEDAQVILYVEVMIPDLKHGCFCQNGGAFIAPWNCTGLWKYQKYWLFIYLFIFMYLFWFGFILFTLTYLVALQEITVLKPTAGSNRCSTNCALYSAGRSSAVVQ